MAGRILVLDDEENYAEMLQGLLRENNYRVDMATRPERAIMQLEEIPYDLVISDFKMPVMDGAGFLKRSRELYPNLPFILVSGLMNTPELVKVANMSVTMVLEKPLDIDLFLRSVARFSAPMTEDEKKESLQRLETLEGSLEEVVSLPGVPKFFSAKSPSAVSFLEESWNILSSGSFGYVGTPAGSDFEFALKDFSEWLGCGDRPIQEYSLSGLLELGMEGLRDADYSEVSNLALVRLSNATEIAQAHEFVESSSSFDEVKVVFQISGSYSDSVKLLGEMIAHVPALCLRKSDLATYARRVARMAAESSSKPKCAEFTNDAVYSILEYEWPRNYVELQAAIQLAVENSPDAPLDLPLFGRVFSSSDALNVVPSSRLKALLIKSQDRVLREMAKGEEEDLEVLLQEFSMDPNIEDFKGLPLLKPELALI